MTNSDYYQILGVARDASPEEIKAAFRRLARLYDPNEFPEAEKEFREINEAYSVLSDPEKRMAYDQFGTQGAGGTGAGRSASDLPGDPTVDAPPPKPKKDDED